MTTKTQQAPPDKATQDRAPRTPPEQLSGWLASLVRTRQYGALADLRRPKALTSSRLLSANFAVEEQHREIYEHVAFLFARFHAGASEPHYGYGSVGTALRKIGSPAGRGPNDAGATRLLDRVVASRTIPWRHLQHAVERSRSCGTFPPSWAGLADDLVRWSERRRPVAY
ncbi:MAG TPA: type I-E CRISPR-associated protein Cse2/CasB, partial [Streptomyces sp.]|nr:type I-E CRISPR-associated protein Cse2/CasB [Streptomyces sp.]